MNLMTDTLERQTGLYGGTTPRLLSGYESDFQILNINYAGSRDHQGRQNENR
jgi:hypothetical protein